MCAVLAQDLAETQKTLMYLLLVSQTMVTSNTWSLYCTYRPHTKKKPTNQHVEPSCWNS